MPFSNVLKDISSGDTTLITVPEGEPALLITSLVVCNLHPHSDILLDLWRQLGAQRYYIETGKVLKGDATRMAYSVPVRAQALAPGESLKAVAYGVEPVEWLEGDSWLDIDWYGLFFNSSSGVAHVNLTVFRG